MRAVWHYADLRLTSRVELRATGEHARKRTIETQSDLTPQEAQISQLVARGATTHALRPGQTEEVPLPLDPALMPMDHFVARILVETPSRMSAKQKKLLEEFRSTETGDECPATKSFFGRARDFLGG